MINSQFIRWSLEYEYDTDVDSFTRTGYFVLRQNIFLRFFGYLNLLNHNTQNAGHCVTARRKQVGNDQPSSYHNNALFNENNN